MRLIPSDPAVHTIIEWMKRDDLDLQPGFQRGVVWSDNKKRRLIDSILRDWHVPPVHVVEVKETGRQEVLDGKQRLVAIDEFAKGLISVDGTTEPHNPDIHNLHGLTYEQLPLPWRRRFDQFSIRFFKITDYLPGEPGELFFRLNQPTNLTSAEQRNAFFGPARAQVKALVDLFGRVGLTKQVLGFSNSRMAYDDIVAKLCLSLDRGNLGQQVTASRVTNRYRSDKPFSQLTAYRAEDAVTLLGTASAWFDKSVVRFNKATLYSWLCFVSGIREAEVYRLSPELLGRFITHFEQQRAELKTTKKTGTDEHLLTLFTDRASSRVSDVSSVLIRDLILWIFLCTYMRELGIPATRTTSKKMHLLTNNLDEMADQSEQKVYQTVLRILDEGWGTEL